MNMGDKYPSHVPIVHTLDSVFEKLVFSGASQQEIAASDIL